MSNEARATAIADALFAQIQQLYADTKSMKAYVRGELDIGAVCRNSKDLVMAFTQAEGDPEDPFIRLQRPPGHAFYLMAGGPPASHSDLSKKQLAKLLDNDVAFERLRAEKADVLLEEAAIWKREIARRAAVWLEERAQ